MAPSAIPVAALAAAPAAAPPAAAEPSAVAPAALGLVDSLPKAVVEDLKIPKDHSALEHYLELLEKLRRSWGEELISRNELIDAQRAAAAAVGLQIENRSGIIEVSPEGGHWLNRWVRRVQESKGVRLYWSPLHNHYDGYVASYDPNGWIMSDRLGPLLDRPSPELFHEFLHAYVDRGRYASKLRPLKTFFFSWCREFPSIKGRKNIGYRWNFESDEILTNLHTAFDRARRITRLYGYGDRGWTASPLDKAPSEVRELVDSLDNPIFLAEAVREMTAQLLPGVIQAAEEGSEGLKGRKFSKSYGRLDGSLSSSDELRANEQKDSAFYAVKLEGVEFRYPSLARLAGDNPDNKTSFPVFLTRGGVVAAQVQFPLSAVARHDLSARRVQESIVQNAAGLAAANLAQLLQVSRNLAPAIEHLKALQETARQNVDVELVRKIQKASKAAFLQALFHFIRRPLPSPPASRLPAPEAP